MLNYIDHECDLIFECRVCRTLFRSIANFILHKREYCREQFNVVSQFPNKFTQVSKFNQFNKLLLLFHFNLNRILQYGKSLKGIQIPNEIPHKKLQRMFHQMKVMEVH